MKTRRDLFRVATEAAALAALPAGVSATPAPGLPHGKPLLELQQAFVDLRFGLFVHLNMATFQDREWGDPAAPAAMFNPTALDTDQWAEAALSANMTWGCLTAKHHDGFCLWPTATRSDSVRHAGRKTDVVRAYVDSFSKYGLKVALHFSMLDMRQDIRHFDVTPDKVALIKAQLTELLTGYGDIDVLILDGWIAHWSRITYEEIPFHDIYALVKRLQPNCLVTDLNAGQFPTGGLYYTDVKAFEQNAGQVAPKDNVLPGYACATLTEDWFWKIGDETRPLKSVDQVVNEWLVPLNARHCNLILNAPSNREGRIAPNLVARLKEIGAAWRHAGPAEKVAEHVVITTPNLATAKPIKASSYPDTIGPDEANDGDFKSFWQPDDGAASAWIEVDLKRETAFNVVAFVEPFGGDDYKHSRIKAYRFQRWDGGGWADLAEGGVPSPVTIQRVARTSARRVRLLIEASENGPGVAEIGVYNEPAYWRAV